MCFYKVFYLLGIVLLIISGFMFIAAVFAWAVLEACGGLFVSGLVCAVFGAALILFCNKKREKFFRPRDSFLLISMAWILAGLAGVLPYLCSGWKFDAALFESFSGFTLTGFTMLDDVEALPKSLLLWRAFSQWLGGAGTLLLFPLLLPYNGEVIEGRLIQEQQNRFAMPMRHNAQQKGFFRHVSAVYMLMSAACLLLFSFSGMEFFQAICHMLSVVSAGGFSSLNGGIAAFGSTYVECVTAVFLFVSGINFYLLFMLFFRRRLRQVLHDQELRLYFLILLAASILAGAALVAAGSGTSGVFMAVFHSISLLSTGGYAIANLAAWPTAAQAVLVILLLFGGCMGSLAGGLKIGRWLLAWRGFKGELTTFFRPGLTQALKYNDRFMDAAIPPRAVFLILLWLGLAALSALLLTCIGFSWQGALLAVAAALSNVGPAAISLHPELAQAFHTPGASYILSFLMLAGRLELLALLAMFTPAFWRR